MSAVADFIEDVGDAVGDFVEAVGDAVEDVADAVVDVVEYVGETVEAIIEDPLPTLLMIAGATVGIPPYVTSAVITGARGGDLGDMILSAGTAYVGAELSTGFQSNVAGSLSSTLVDAGASTAVATVVTNSIGSGLVAGTISEIRGGDFVDGFTGGLVGGVVGAGVTELTNIVSDATVTIATNAVSSDSIANNDFTAGFDTAVTTASTTVDTGTTVGDTFATTVTNFDSVDTSGSTGTTGTVDLSTSGSGVTADVISDVTVSNIGFDTAGVDSTFTGDTAGATGATDTATRSLGADTSGTSNVVDAVLNSGNTAGSDFVGDSGGLDSVADILTSLNTDTGATALDTAGDAGIDTTLNATLDTAGDTAGEPAIGGLDTLNTELTGGSDIDTGDEVVGGLTAVAGNQGLDNAETVVTDAAGNDVVVRAGNVIADTSNAAGATDTVGGLTQAQTANTNLNVDSAADNATTGGLNQASNIGAKDDAFSKILKGTVTKAVTGAIKSGATNSIKKALGVNPTKRPTATKQFVGNVAPKIAGKVAPKSMDISKLTPVNPAKKTAPLKANVSNLTPVSRISGLSTLVNRKG